MTHQTQITQQIFDVCHDHAITALYAIESGSRAWGFASTNSDFDVRLIYHHSPDWYLQIYEDKDTFEFINHDLLSVPFDIGGWDIKKALVHIHKSNAVIFEWLNSPIVYHSDDRFINRIKEFSDDFFNPQAVYHHYQGMAKKSWADLDLDKPVKLKKWCYLLRSLLASLWIKEHESIPPVLINEMFVLLSRDESDEISHLIHIKQSQDEHYLHALSPSLQQCTLKLWQSTQSLQFNQKPKGDVDVLNALFRKMVFSS